MSVNAIRDLIYVCSHDENGGIYCFDLSEKGKLTQISFTYADRPAYAVIEDGNLYAVLREAEPMQSGVKKYSLNNPACMPELIGTMLTHGAVAAHLCVHDGSVYCVNYLSGSSICLPDGIVIHNGHGPHPTRQTSSHPHQIIPTPDGKYLVINDLGTDRIEIYTPGLKKLCSFVDAPAGSGSRHGIFSPDGKFYYCVGELDSTLSMYSYSRGRLKYICSCPTIPDSFHGENTASAIRLYGKNIYVSNRGHDSVCVLRRSGKEIVDRGYIEVRGKSPREFNFCGDFLICGNEGSSNITVFRMRKDGFADYCSTVEGVVNPWCIIPYKGEFSQEIADKYLDF